MILTLKKRILWWLDTTAVYNRAVNLCTNLLSQDTSTYLHLDFYFLTDTRHSSTNLLSQDLPDHSLDRPISFPHPILSLLSVCDGCQDMKDSYLEIRSGLTCLNLVWSDGRHLANRISEGLQMATWQVKFDFAKFAFIEMLSKWTATIIFFMCTSHFISAGFSFGS